MNGHWIGSLIILVLGVAGVWFSRSLPTDKTQELGTSFFPLLISLFLCGCATLSLFSFFLKRKKGFTPIQWANRPASLRIAISLILFTSYAFTLEGIGFLISTFLLLFIFCKVVFGKSWLGSVGVASMAVISSYALLSWALGVRLPVSTWLGV